MIYEKYTPEYHIHDIQKTVKYVINSCISKYELPKDQERCDSQKNQSTLFIKLRNNKLFTDDKMFYKYGDIKDLRLANTNIKCIEYYDSRCADKCYKDFHGMKYQGTEIYVRYVWDLSTKVKWEIIRFTDNVISQYLCTKKKEIVRNMFTDMFDEFLVENIDEISKSLLGEVDLSC
jgi:hypothetical protein